MAGDRTSGRGTHHGHGEPPPRTAPPGTAGSTVLHAPSDGAVAGALARV